MSTKFDNNETTLQDIEQLEQLIDELAGVISKLKHENRVLSAQQKDLSQERASLIEKNDLARTRVESMIVRLKSMEESA